MANTYDTRSFLIEPNNLFRTVENVQRFIDLLHFFDNNDETPANEEAKIAADELLTEISTAVGWSGEQAREVMREKRRLAEDAADNILRMENEGREKASDAPEGTEAFAAFKSVQDLACEIHNLSDCFLDHDWEPGSAVPRDVVGNLYAAEILLSRVQTLVKKGSDAQARSEGDPV